MIKYMCEYAEFVCEIKVLNRYKRFMDRFKNEYGFYYDIFLAQEEKSIAEATINIVEEAFCEELVQTQMVCIHSSHSCNLKYLLNGETYTQKEASLYARVNQKENALLYFIESTNTKIYLDLERKEIYISGGDLYNTLVYVFETLLSVSIENKGGIQFHAACCELDGKGYIITGKSGSGKTTLLFDMLEKGGLFHSNDRVVVFIKNGDIIAYSIPIPVNVPINTMRTLEAWKGTELVRNAEPNSKIRFRVCELQKLFAKKRIATTRISNIIVVDYVEQDPVVTKLTNEKIQDYVEVLTPYDENHPKWLPIFESPDAEKINSKLQIINKKVSLVKISGRDISRSFFKTINLEEK